MRLAIFEIAVPDLNGSLGGGTTAQALGGVLGDAVAGLLADPILDRKSVV